MTSYARPLIALALTLALAACAAAPAPWSVPLPPVVQSTLSCPARVTPTGRVMPSQTRGRHAILHRRHPSTAARAFRLVQAVVPTVDDDDVVARTPCKVKGASTEHAAERPVAAMQS